MCNLMPLRILTEPPRATSPRKRALAYAISSVLLWLAFSHAPAPAGGLQHTRTRSGAALSDRSRASLNRADRHEVFDEVWQTVNERYYDPSFKGIDWDFRLREKGNPVL